MHGCLVHVTLVLLVTGLWHCCRFSVEAVAPVDGKDMVFVYWVSRTVGWSACPVQFVHQLLCSTTLQE